MCRDWLRRQTGESQCPICGTANRDELTQIGNGSKMCPRCKAIMESKGGKDDET